MDTFITTFHRSYDYFINNYCSSEPFIQYTIFYNDCTRVSNYTLSAAASDIDKRIHVLLKSSQIDKKIPVLVKSSQLELFYLQDLLQHSNNHVLRSLKEAQDFYPQSQAVWMFLILLDTTKDYNNDSIIYFIDRLRTINLQDYITIILNAFHYFLCNTESEQFNTMVKSYYEYIKPLPPFIRKAVTSDIISLFHNCFEYYRIKSLWLPEIITNLYRLVSKLDSATIKCEILKSTGKSSEVLKQVLFQVLKQVPERIAVAAVLQDLNYHKMDSNSKFSVTVSFYDDEHKRRLNV
jgi:hypothetical protein